MFLQKKQLDFGLNMLDRFNEKNNDKRLKTYNFKPFIIFKKI